MELWDVVNRDGSTTGRTIVRGQPLQTGEYHLVVHIWVIDDVGQFLIQKRADHIQLFPGVWATTGGSALAGENSQTAAMRELREEMGIDVQPDNLRKLRRIVRADNLLDIWLVETAVSLEELRLQKEEVSAAMLVDRDTLQRMIGAGTFHNYGRDYMDIVFGATANRM